MSTIRLVYFRDKAPRTAVVSVPLPGVVQVSLVAQQQGREIGWQLQFAQFVQ